MRREAGSELCVEPSTICHLRQTRNTLPPSIDSQAVVLIKGFHAHSVTQECIIIIIYPLTGRVFGAPQIISQSVSSIFPCSPLPSVTWWTPGLSGPWWCLPTSSSVCLVFFRLSLSLTKWFWSDLVNGRHDHTTTVCVSLQWSRGLRVVRLPAGSWHGLHRKHTKGRFSFEVGSILYIMQLAQQKNADV